MMVSLRPLRVLRAGLGNLRTRLRRALHWPMVSHYTPHSSANAPLMRTDRPQAVELSSGLGPHSTRLHFGSALLTGAQPRLSAGEGASPRRRRVRQDPAAAFTSQPSTKGTASVCLGHPSQDRRVSCIELKFSRRLVLAGHRVAFEVHNLRSHRRPASVFVVQP
jgi:hypothetical protein